MKREILVKRVKDKLINEINERLKSMREEIPEYGVDFIPLEGETVEMVEEEFNKLINEYNVLNKLKLYLLNPTSLNQSWDLDPNNYILKEDKLLMIEEYDFIFHFLFYYESLEFPIVEYLLNDKTFCFDVFSIIDNVIYRQKKEKENKEASAS